MTRRNHFRTIHQTHKNTKLFKKTAGRLCENARDDQSINNVARDRNLIATYDWIVDHGALMRRHAL